MYRYDIVQAFMRTTSAHTYLEIGVKNGDSFFRVTGKRKIAVDPHFCFPKTVRFFAKRFINRLKHIVCRNIFCEQTSDSFFENKPFLFAKRAIDVAFVDGLHTYEQAYRDITNCLKYLSSDGVIIVHDCNPISAVIATPLAELDVNAITKQDPSWTGAWSGDVWKAIVRLRSEKNDLDIYTLDTDFGVSVIFKGIPKNTLSFTTSEITKLTYSDLENNRTAWLNLKKSDYLQHLLKKNREAQRICQSHVK